MSTFPTDPPHYPPPSQQQQQQQQQQQSSSSIISAQQQQQQHPSSSSILPSGFNHLMGGSSSPNVAINNYSSNANANSTTTSTTNLVQLQRMGELLWGKMDKINAEFFNLTYGAFMQSLLLDFDVIPRIPGGDNTTGDGGGDENVCSNGIENRSSTLNGYEKINNQLESMGYNIGIRILDEYASKVNLLGSSGSGGGNQHHIQSVITFCDGTFKKSMELIAKVGFKMFLGINTDIVQWNDNFTQCSLVIYDNPLSEFVELPPQLSGKLWYSNILCGVLRGSLEMIQMRVDAKFVKDVLQGDEITEIKLEFKGMIEETMGDEYKEN